MVAQRYEESLPISEKALALARAVGAREAEVRALTVLGVDLAYLGHGPPALVHVRQALQLAEEIGDRVGLERAYVNFTDALTMLGRCQESARLGKSGLEAMHQDGIESTLLVSNTSSRCSRSETGMRRTSSVRPLFAQRQPASPTTSSSSAPTSRSAAAPSRPPASISRTRVPRCVRTGGWETTSSTSLNWLYGNSGGRRQTRPFVTA